MSYAVILLITRRIYKGKISISNAIEYLESNWDKEFDLDNTAEAAKYMSKIEIIKGGTGGYFMPKSTTTAQQAAGYGTATREAVILMSVRFSDKISALP